MVGVGYIFKTVSVCSRALTGGQVQDPDGDRKGKFDTICPVDFEKSGQITSDTLHRVLVTPLAPGVRLTVIFDCCHCQFCPS
jgi:Caspase domain